MQRDNNDYDMTDVFFIHPHALYNGFGVYINLNTHSYIQRGTCRKITKLHLQIIHKCDEKCKRLNL